VKHGLLTKALSIVGTVLVWFPLAATLLTGLVGSIARQRLRVDWLMPAELGLFAVVGGGLLVWAALRARAERGLICGSLGAAVALVVGGQALAVVTGLASGEREPVGWPWALVLASLAGYVLALAALGIGGVRLVRSVLRRGAAQQ